MKASIAYCRLISSQSSLAHSSGPMKTRDETRAISSEIIGLYVTSVHAVGRLG